MQVGELFVKLNLDTSLFSKELESARQKLLEISKKKEYKVNLGVNADTAAITKTVNEVARSGQVAQQSVGAFNALGGAIKTAFSFAGGMLLANAITSIAQALPNAVGQAADFEQAISNVGAVAGGLTTAQLEALRQKALQVGADTSISASQAAAAMEALVANGIKVDDQFNSVVDATVALKEATGSDLVTAANVATDVLQNFADEGLSLEHIVNGITGVTVAGKFQINDYALALSNGGVAAHGYGVTLDDFNAAIAATSASFKSGQTAGTAFRTFIERLTPSTKVATEEMKRLGLITAEGTNIFYDQNGAIRSQEEIFGILATTFGDMTDAQRAASAEMIFGADAAEFVTAAIAKGSAGFREYADAISQVSAADIAKARLDNFTGAVEQLKGSMETFSITVGSLVLPALTDFVQGITAAVNVATDIVNALSGSEEAFNSLSPAMQVVVSVLQDVIAMFQSFISQVQVTVNDGLNTLTGFFDSIASAAFGWGSSAGDNFAAGLISAVSSVVEAAMAYGEALDYWLAPGSPPRIAPELDQWGKEVGEVYIEGMASADTGELRRLGDSIQEQLQKTLGADSLDTLSAFTSQAKALLGSFVGIGKATDLSVVEQVIGSREVFSMLLSELETTGDVSQRTFDRIRDVVGENGSLIADLAENYVDLQKATANLKGAQDNLLKTQEKLKKVQEEYNAATAGLKEQLEDVQRQNQLADIDQQIKEQEELANAVGGSGEIQAEAERKLQELLLERAILLQEIAFDDPIDAAEAEVAIAEEAVATAENQVDVAQEQYNLTLAQINAQKENNDLVKQQIELFQELLEEQKKANEEATKSGGGGGGGGAAAIDKSAEAQAKYNYQIADTQGKLDILRAKLAGVEEGSEEYYQILGQIHGLEEQQSKEQERLAEEELKAAEEKIKAQRDYEYSIADTSGKLAILRNDLKDVEQGSVEYYRILGQIATLERQQAREAQSGGSGGGIGGIGGSQGGIRRPELPTLPGQGTTDPGDANDRHPSTTALETAKAEATRLLGELKAIFTALTMPIMQVWNAFWTGISGYVAPIMENIKAAITAGLTIIVGFWQEHGAQITSQAQTIWNQILGIISTIASIIGEWLSQWTAAVANTLETQGTGWKSVMEGVWTAISGVITTALGVIQAILNGVLAAMQGNWSGVWQAILSVANSIWQGIISLMTGVLQIIAGLLSTNLANLQTMWQTWLSNTYAFWNTTSANILSALNTWASQIVAGFNELIRMATDAWNNWTRDLQEGWNVTSAAIVRAVTTWASNIKRDFDTLVADVKGAWEKLNELPTKLGEWLSSAASKITEMIGQFTSAATSVGSAIIDGIKKGIEDGIEGLKGAAESAVSAAIEAAKDLLRIDSPSKVTMEMGEFFSQGFAEGITNQLAPITNAAGLMATSAIGSLPTQSATAMGTSISYGNITIDARGSTMTESQFRSVVKDMLDETGKRTDMRKRF